MLRPLLALALAAGCLTLGQPASAAEDHVPVANADAITLWAGSTDVLLDVLANDTDADGHRDLDICRFDPPWNSEVLVQREWVEGPGVLEIEVGIGASAGTYAVDYQACDYSYIVTGTLTVTVQPVEVTTVTRVPGRPGRLRITNPDQHDVFVAWYPPRREVPSGYVEVPAGESVVVPAGATGRLEWFALFEDDDITVYTGLGRLKGPASRSLSPVAAESEDDAVDPTTVPPPVTGDEEVTRWAGSMGYVDVLANDSDPQGQPLDVCRVAPSGRDVSGFVEEWNGRFRLDTREKRSGTYTVTYYACNEHRLSPGTVTVHLKQAEPVEITRTDRTGGLRIVNRNPEAVRVELHDEYDWEQARTVRVPADSRRRVHLDADSIRWWARIGSMRGYAGDGYLR